MTVSPEGMSERFHKDLAELDDTPLPDDMNIPNQAQKDYRGMVKALSKTGKRKTFPEWGVPAEALHMAMAPGRAKRERETLSDRRTSPKTSTAHSLQGSRP